MHTKKPMMALGVTAFCLVLGAACSCSDNSPAVSEDGGALDASVDAMQTEDAYVADAQPDSGDFPLVVHFDFCDDAVFKLPMDGTEEETSSPDMWGHLISYVRYPAGIHENLHPRVFNIDECTETQFSPDSFSGITTISPNLIVWPDGRYYENGQWDHCGDLHMIDFETMEETRLTNDTDCELTKQTNGYFLGYTKASYDPEYRITGPSSLQLMDLSTFEITEIAPGQDEVAYVDMDERYLIWGGEPQLQEA